ncbi:MAG TPA: winged helix-turn-helix domain-containing protein [Nitrososphaera sp.]|jgi:predicted transcriptional regulator|nr:winged helix-turn-helix domain-containing protein [Nitrososphaera sp.]
MKYRSRTDIVADILDAASGYGANKTKIMYRAYLSFGQVKEYLSVLIASGLLERIEAVNVYRTTEKGKKFMRGYSHMDELIGPLQE